MPERSAGFQPVFVLGGEPSAVLYLLATVS